MSKALPIYITDKVATQSVLSPGWERMLRRCRPGKAPHSTYYLVLNASEILAPESHPTFHGWVTSRARYLVMLDVHEGALPHLPRRLRIRNPASRLHVSSDPTTLRRLSVALQRRDPIEGIVDAYELGDSLFVILGDLVTRSVKWEKLSDLRESDPESRRSFEIDDDGSFIRWRSFDIHLGAVHFLEILNPEYVAQIEIDDISRWLVGDAVRTVRERHNLYQTDFQGLSDRQVRRIENGESSLTISAAKEFADSFGISLSDFVEELARTTASLRKGGDRNAVSRAY